MFSHKLSLTEKQYIDLMNSLQTLTLAVTNLTTAVAAIPVGAPVSGDPGLTAAQANSLAATINAQTAILVADVAPTGTTGTPGVPLAPASFTGVSAGNGVVNLSFSPSDGATSYLVEYAYTSGSETASGITNVTVPAPTTSPVTVSLTGLTVGKPLFIEVFASNAAGTSPSSLEITVTP